LATGSRAVWTKHNRAQRSPKSPRGPLQPRRLPGSHARSQLNLTTTKNGTASELGRCPERARPPQRELRRISLPRTPVNKSMKMRVGCSPIWHEKTCCFARRSGCSPGLRRGVGGSTHGSAHSSAPFGGGRGGGRALEGGCGPRPLFRPRSLRPFNGRRRRNRTHGRQRAIPDHP
jgi:hypothetical protein